MGHTLVVYGQHVAEATGTGDRQVLSRAVRILGVTPEVRRTDPDGVDYGWVMQVTFVVTILVGAPVVTLLSTQVSLPTWTDRAMFAVQVGAPIWFITAVSVYLYARRQQQFDLP